MYGLLIGLDVELSLRDRYAAVRRLLEQRGFVEEGMMLFLGGERVNAVDCVLAIQELGLTYEWFKPSIRNISMLRIEANDDLAPVLD